MDNELLLVDRIGVIRDTITKYGEENFYLSFSGGKDSTILHHLIDMALPNNQIPRVFINTGIEYNSIVKFVKELAEKDKRFVLLKPTKNIKQTLETYGYPFKSKQHSHNHAVYANNRDEFEKVQHQIAKDGSLLNNYDFIHNLPNGVKAIVKYFYGVRERVVVSCIHTLTAPNILKYQFSKSFTLKLSDQCCYRMKKQVIHKWERENGRKVAITGMRAEEGGMRTQIGCILTDKSGNLKKFHPLVKVDDLWEDWFVKSKNIKLCELYYPPYNFKRTGCKGCPFALGLEEQLKTMEKLLPNERKQCEIIWQPVYEEYRKIGYRLSSSEQLSLLEEENE